MSTELEAAFERARRWEANATPEEKAAMRAAQRESWVRGMTTPCEHGVLDFEQCPDCRAQATPNTSPERVSKSEDL